MATTIEKPKRLGAERFVPPTRSLRVLQKAVDECRGCELYKNATQGVFGEGPKQAVIMLVGEQPGDQEDRQGHPFVGPAGRVLDHVLEGAKIPREEVFVTNVVKHYYHEMRGKRRMHKRPTIQHVRACFPWFEKELSIVRPQVLVLLGATAAQAVLGGSFRLTKHRGEFFETDFAPHTTATIHPSAVLRAPSDEQRRAMREEYLEDFKAIAKVYRKIKKQGLSW